MIGVRTRVSIITQQQENVFELNMSRNNFLPFTYFIFFIMQLTNLKLCEVERCEWSIKVGSWKLRPHSSFSSLLFTHDQHYTPILCYIHIMLRCCLMHKLYQETPNFMFTEHFNLLDTTSNIISLIYISSSRDILFTIMENRTINSEFSSLKNDNLKYS